MVTPLTLDQYALVLAHLQHPHGQSREQVLGAHSLTIEQWRSEADRWSNLLLQDIEDGSDQRIAECQARFDEAQARVAGAAHTPSAAMLSPMPMPSPPPGSSGGLAEPPPLSRLMPPGSPQPATTSPWAVSASAPPSLRAMPEPPIAPQPIASPAPVVPPAAPPVFPLGEQASQATHAATPFAKGADSAPPPPSALADLPAADSGGTEGVDNKWLALAAVPFGGNKRPDAAEGSGETGGVDQKWLGKAAVPFAGNEQSKSTPGPSSPPPAKKQVVAMMAMPDPSLAPGLIALDASAPAAPKSAESHLSVEQYASLCAECAAYPAEADAVCARYVVQDEPSRLALHAHWQQRFASDAALQRRWQELMDQYRTWLLSQPRRS